jgi:hypothetical protein
MLIIGYIIFGFSLVQLIVALSNLIFSQPFSKTAQNQSPMVSVLVPARNEEKNIANIIRDIQNQKYPNFELIIFNDESTDQTEDIVRKYGKNDKRIKLINSTGLPVGWLGKNHACYSLAQAANGKYYLFLDADVRISGDIIGSSLAALNKQGLGLLSIFPVQIMRTFGERLTVPNMNFILLTLLPLVLVRAAAPPSLAAANGQFMFFKADSYKKLQPHLTHKYNKVEDIETARYFKKNKIKVACLSGKKDIRCRMYNGFNESVNGFSRNVVMFFGNSFLLALIFWIITTFGFIAVWITFPLLTFLLYLLILISTRIFVSIVSHQNIIINLMLAIPQQFTLGLIIFKSFINNQNKAFEWKGRNIS